MRRRLIWIGVALAAAFLYELLPAIREEAERPLRMTRFPPHGYAIRIHDKHSVARNNHNPLDPRTRISHRITWIIFPDSAGAFDLRSLRVCEQVLADCAPHPSYAKGGRILLGGGALEFQDAPYPWEGWHKVELSETDACRSGCMEGPPPGG